MNITLEIPRLRANFLRSFNVGRNLAPLKIYFSLFIIEYFSKNFYLNFLGKNF